MIEFVFSLMIFAIVLIGLGIVTSPVWGLLLGLSKARAWYKKKPEKKDEKGKKKGGKGKGGNNQQGSRSKKGRQSS